MSQLVFFSSFVAIENIDITQILSLQDGEAVYPLPRIRSLAVHPKLNLAALLFAVLRSCCVTLNSKQDLAGEEHVKNRAAYTRDGRKQLFAVLQSARGSNGKLS
ncbi:hypothetical protein GW17_00029553 [Ensete ventricosum]|nr:hypothetical protein GW17_00029553 [Ensete ventricosum]